MKIEYIFIRKENVSTKIEDNLFTTTPPLHVVLGKIFTNVSQDTINLKYKTKEYSVPYHYVEHECENDDGNSAIQYLTMELDYLNLMKSIANTVLEGNTPIKTQEKLR